MWRKVWSATLGLGLLVAGCGSQKPGSEPVKIAFVPQTVDFLDDVGYSPSLVVDKDGSPFLSYLGFTHVQTKAEKKAGVIPPARPVTAPRLPAVLVATQVNGIWSRDAAVQSSDQATGPKVPIGRSDQTATAADQNGTQHVVWTEKNGLFYSNDSSGSFPDTPTKITGSPVTGPSIAVDSSGTPWIAFYNGSAIDAATVSGNKVSIQKVASVGSCCERASARTATAAGKGGPIIAYFDRGANVPALATRSGKSWSMQRIGSGGGGFGISMGLGPDGTPHLSYFQSNGDVVVATVSGGAASTTTAASITVTHPSTDLAGGTAIAVTSKGTEYVAWTDPASGVRLAQSTNGTDFQRVATEGTDGGEFPTMATTPDGRAVLAWFLPKTQDLMLGTYPEKEVGLLAAPSPSATVAAATGAPPQACAPSDVDITAPPGAATTGFATTKVSAASTSVTVCFANKDSTIHNVAIFKSESDATSGGSALFTGSVEQGPTQVEYKVGTLAAGDYFFRCDVHPTTMTGTLTVK